MNAIFHSLRIRFKQDPLLFQMLLILALAPYLYLTFSHRMVRGHDGYGYFTLQYYFLNHAVMHGKIPEWLPYLTQGSVATWWYAMQAGVLQNVLLLFSNLWNAFNFLPLYYAALFTDSLILLLGVWLLARRFFKSSVTCFFVTFSAVFSYSMTDGVWWDFHFYYAVPLILHTLHLFLDRAQWRYAVMAVNLLALQTLGNMPYMLPVTSWVIFMYFLFYFILNPKLVWFRIRALKWNIWAGLASALMVASLLAAFRIQSIGVDQVASYTAGRMPDGSTPLHDFLTYASTYKLNRWSEFLLGFSPNLDYSLYLGVAFIPLFVLGLLSGLRPENGHWLAMLLVLFLFSVGSGVAVFFYHIWPMMKYFRHIALVTGFMKLFFCLVAGLGFERILIQEARRWWPLYVVTIVLLAGSWWLWGFLNDPGKLSQWVSEMSLGYTFYGIADFNFILPKLRITTGAAVTLFLLFSFLCWKPGAHYRRVVMVLILAVQILDLTSYVFMNAHWRTVPLPPSAYDLLKFQTLPYVRQRGLELQKKNPRLEFLKYHGVQVKGVSGPYSGHGPQVDSFLFLDLPKSLWQTHSWMKPLDRYIRTFAGMPPDGYETEGPSEDLQKRDFNFPQPAAQKMSGITAEKIQFFSKAAFFNSDEAIASVLTKPDFSGDWLLLSAAGGNESVQAVAAQPTPEINPAENARLLIPYEVKHFDSNHLALSIQVEGTDPVWLFYSDVWHPAWKATLNGAPAPVYRANLAYKAVELQPGNNEVHFKFELPWLALTRQFFQGSALFWLGYLLFLTIQLGGWGCSPAPELR